MKVVILSVLIFHVGFAVKHHLLYFLSESSGLPNFPEFVGSSMIDDIMGGYCDSQKGSQPKANFMIELAEDYPNALAYYAYSCVLHQYIYRARIADLKQHLNQTGDVHTFQIVFGCEWDNETGNVSIAAQVGYNGEDFIALDPKNLTWVAVKPEAAVINQIWETDEYGLGVDLIFFPRDCPRRLRQYLQYLENYPQETESPSVFLLQRTPSSPVSCYATGFYPDRAMMFWRKDGEEIHEGVNHGEILPNHDGTFQMSVDLNVSSVLPEDWRRYDCVFSLSGVKDDIITRLDKSQIRTNWGKTVPPLLPVSRPSEVPIGSIIGGVIGVLLLVLVLPGLFIWQRNKKASDPSSSDHPSIQDVAVTTVSSSSSQLYCADNILHCSL